MKKRVLAAALLLLFLLSGCNFSFGGEVPEENVSSPPNGEEARRESEEMRGVWITYDELSVAGEKDPQKAFAEKTETMFGKIADFGFNSVFVHVRAFCDAFYKSSLYPWSAYLTGTQGEDPGFDPLAVMLEKAHEKNLAFHAWINPYRISNITDTAKLSKNNPARVWLEADVYDRRVLTSSGLHFNPASEDARRLIIDGVREIIENYDVDGIHFDDYFYPQADLFIDEAEYNAYNEKGGEMTQQEWRKENVNRLIREVYRVIKAKNPKISFGISPSGNIEANESTLFADVKTWAAVEGYVDYLCPQLYYGFENSVCPFRETAQAWSDIVSPSVKLYAGLAAYKCGKTEQGKNMSEKAKNEWAENDDILSRQIESVKICENYCGFIMFSYDALFSAKNQKNISKELKNITNLS